MTNCRATSVGKDRLGLEGLIWLYILAWSGYISGGLGLVIYIQAWSGYIYIFTIRTFLKIVLGTSWSLRFYDVYHYTAIYLNLLCISCIIHAGARLCMMYIIIYRHIDNVTLTPHPPNASNPSPWGTKNSIIFNYFGKDLFYSNTHLLKKITKFLTHLNNFTQNFQSLPVHYFTQIFETKFFSSVKIM
jgi:hypothetical protein